MTFQFLKYDDLKKRTEEFLQGYLNYKHAKSIDELREPRRSQSKQIYALIRNLDTVTDQLAEEKSRILTAGLVKTFNEVEHSYDEGLIYGTLTALGAIKKENSYFYRNLPSVWGEIKPKAGQMLDLQGQQTKQRAKNVLEAGDLENINSQYAIFINKHPLMEHKQKFSSTLAKLFETPQLKPISEQTATVNKNKDEQVQSSAHDTKDLIKQAKEIATNEEKRSMARDLDEVVVIHNSKPFISFISSPSSPVLNDNSVEGEELRYRYTR